MCVFVCLRVCERVRGVGWKLLCSSRDRADPWTRRKDGDCLTSRGVRCPRRRPGLDGFAAGAPSNSGAAQEPPEVTRGFARERGARSPRLAPCPAAAVRQPPGFTRSSGGGPSKLLGFLRRAILRGGTVWRRERLVQSLGPPEEMEVFSLILVVSVCWTRTWKAAIADSIIHIGKGLLRLLVLLDTFPALLSQPSLSWHAPPADPALFYPLLAFFVCLFVCSLLIIASHWDLRASSFSPTALCKGLFCRWGYVRALDLEVLRG